MNCGSTVDHLICFDCEKKWREKMPIRNGKRTMTCVTCRQEETTRTMESLERELAALYVSRQAPTSIHDALRVIVRLGPVERSFVAHHILSTVNSTASAAGAAAAAVSATGGGGSAAVSGAGGEAAAAAVLRRSSTHPPPRMFCESGRDCQTASRIHSRTKTHLKCRQCNVVACCAKCRRCTGCVPV